MTLEEVFLVFGGHVGLLIHSLQKDGNPTQERRNVSGGTKGQTQLFLGRVWVGV